MYSTCSVHVAENENVVRQALSSEEAASGQFILAPRSQVLPSWDRRGLPDVEGNDLGMSDFSGSLSGLTFDQSSRIDGADNMVRCSPEEDATNGFFVSCFVKSGLEHARGSSDVEHGPRSPPPKIAQSEPVLAKRKRTESDGLTGEGGQGSGTKKRKKKTKKRDLRTPQLS